MKKNIHNRRLEQIVTKELVKDLSREGEEEQLQPEATESLYEHVNRSGKNSVQLSEEEKNALIERIGHSIHQKQKSRKLVLKISSVAATFAALIVCSFLIVQNMSDSGITKYAKNFDKIPADGNTHLFLGKDEKVRILSEDTQIRHLKNSTEISIDDNDKVEQELGINKLIYNTLYVPFGKKTRIVLSDNSTIWLNSGSKFIYPAEFSDKKREVFLEGEAVFDVAENKHKPFVVVTNDLEVKVLGTVFNVSAYPDDNFTSTALKSGAVEINFKKNFFKNETVKITPGTVAVFNKDDERITQTEEDISKYTSWRCGILILDKEPLRNIVNKLSRFHNVDIEITSESIANETFGGRLEYNDSVVKTLETIKEIVDFELSVNEHRIIISKK